jgi:energy-coupling factor transporter ATP-binding protein EcfA2
MLRRLKIQEFRNVRPGTEIHFNDGFNVVLGLNASGKTTLLELIAAIVRGDLSGLSTFRISFDLEHDGARLEVECGRIVQTVEDEEDMEHEPIEGFLHASGYDRDGRLVGTLQGDHQFWTVGRDGNTVGVQAPEYVFHRLVDQVTNAIWKTSRETPHFSVRDCHRVDESLMRFQEMHGVNGEATARLHTFWNNNGLLRILARNLAVDLDDLSLVLQQQKSSQPVGIEINHTQSKFLAEAADWLGFAGCVWRASLLSQEPADKRLTATYGKFSFGFTGPDARFVDDAILSYGQKRLLALLYHLRLHNGPFVADELVNGLHHAWIERLMAELSGRQVFVSTQNPLLLDYLTFASADDVQRTFIFCSQGNALDHQESLLVWRGLSDDNARAFFEAYEAGIQHVSELLRVGGFW